MVTDTADDIPLGAEVKDRVSGAHGIVIEKAYHISGCDRIGVREVDETPKQGEKSHFFPSQLEVVEEDTEFADEADDAIVETDELELGHRAIDTVTGYQGIISVINVGLWKTPDTCLTDQKGEEMQAEWFDDVRLEQTSDEAVWSFEDDTDREMREETTGPTGSSSPDRSYSPN